MKVLYLIIILVLIKFTFAGKVIHADSFNASSPFFIMAYPPGTINIAQFGSFDNESGDITYYKDQVYWGGRRWFSRYDYIKKIAMFASSIDIFTPPTIFTMVQVNTSTVIFNGTTENDFKIRSVDYDIETGIIYAFEVNDWNNNDTYLFQATLNMLVFSPPSSYENEDYSSSNTVYRKPIVSLTPGQTLFPFFRDERYSTYYDYTTKQMFVLSTMYDDESQVYLTTIDVQTGQILYNVTVLPEKWWIWQVIYLPETDLVYIYTFGPTISIYQYLIAVDYKTGDEVDTILQVVSFPFYYPWNVFDNQSIAYAISSQQMPDGNFNTLFVYFNLELNTTTKSGFLPGTDYYFDNMMYYAYIPPEYRN